MSGAPRTDVAGTGRFRFSLRWLLVFTAGVAVLLAVGVRVYRTHVADRRPWRLHEAINSGDLPEVDRLLEIDPRLAAGRTSGSMSSSHTPLEKAIVFGPNPKIIDRILQERPDLDETSSSGETALHLAVQHRKIAEVEKLVRLGADVNAVDEDGIAPLHLAAEVDANGDVIRLLLRAGADPNVADADGIAPLHTAAYRNRNGRLTKLLLDADSDPDRQSQKRRLDGKSALHLAAERANDAAAGHLLTAGGDANLRDKHGRTPLHTAVSRNELDLAKLLIEHGANLAARDNAGLLPGELESEANTEIAALLWWEQIVRLHDGKKLDTLNATLDDVPQVVSFGTGYPPQQCSTTPYSTSGSTYSITSWPAAWIQTCAASTDRRRCKMSVGLSRSNSHGT